MNDLQKELARIQKELKAPKGQTNSFGGYKYRSCEDILEAVKPLLGDSTLYLSDEVVNVGSANYVKATATLQNGNDRIWVHAFAREAVDKKGMDDAQITGAASSYARKYALNGLFAIDDTKDADTMDNTKTITPKATKSPVAKETTSGGAKYCANHPTGFLGKDQHGNYYNTCYKGKVSGEPCDIQDAGDPITERDIKDYQG